MTQSFIVTKEHRRFTEFANAVKKERTIGICHGDAGVGKTNSARRYANWDTLEPFITAWGPRSGTTRNITRSRIAPAPCSTHPRSSRDPETSWETSADGVSKSASVSTSTSAPSGKSPE